MSSISNVNNNNSTPWYLLSPSETLKSVKKEEEEKIKMQNIKNELTEAKIKDILDKFLKTSQMEEELNDLNQKIYFYHDKISINETQLKKTKENNINLNQEIEKMKSSSLNVYNKALKALKEHNNIKN